MKKTDYKLRDLAADFDQWPESWKGTARDLTYGKKLLPSMEAFLEDLIARGLSRTTLRRYCDDIFLLGRTIIREVSLYQEYRRTPLKKLCDSVKDGGILPDGIDDEAGRKSFERMCERFKEFLQKSSGTASAGKGRSYRG